MVAMDALGIPNAPDEVLLLLVRRAECSRRHEHFAGAKSRDQQPVVDETGLKSLYNIQTEGLDADA
jgi:hypothetical protein